MLDKIIVTVALLSSYLIAADVSTSIDSVKKHNNKLAVSQENINKLDDKTKSMLESYHNILEETRKLKEYNQQVSLMLDSQKNEITAIKDDIVKIEKTKQDIYPLMHEMIDALENFVSLDKPFLLDERLAKITTLKNMINQANVTVAEKYRRIVEAYQDENDFSRNIESYQGILSESGKTVKFLRIGRVGLYYQSIDDKECGMWNSNTNSWEKLSNEHLRTIKQGLLMANKQLSPNLLALPVNIQEDK